MALEEHFEYRYATLRDTEHGSTRWKVRVRGDVDKLVPHEYTCPEHGRFTLQVKASEVPDKVACAVGTLVGVAAGFGTVAPRQQRCGMISPWAGASVAIGLQPGEVAG